jgi:putative SOS response-associated peptidase YedK
MTDSAPDLAAMFDIEHEAGALPEPSWNVKPTEQIPIVLESMKSDPAVRRLEPARWSLVPTFSPELGSTFATFNARAETVADKPTFRTALAKTRAIIPTAGYYEWRTVGTVKTPFFVHSDDGLPLALAGLYSWWRNPALSQDDPARWVLTATVLTMPAQGALTELHDRMPVVLPEEAWDRWLDPHAGGDQALVDAVLDVAAEAAAGLAFYEVAPLTGEDAPELIDAVGPEREVGYSA